LPFEDCLCQVIFVTSAYHKMYSKCWYVTKPYIIKLNLYWSLLMCGLASHTSQ
jgi:hypothetical protein